MRAVYYPYNIEETIILEDEKFHHVINVARAKVGDDILLLDGKGLKAYSTLVSINKKKAILEVFKKEINQLNHKITLGLCIPKREALDLSIKQAVEIGVQKVFLINSEFSVNKSINFDRLERLIESAMEQSNNPFKLEVEQIDQLENISMNHFQNIVCLSSQDESNGCALKSMQETLLIIGPEGGFSESERNFLKHIENIKMVYLPTNILRTPTALSVGCGYLLSDLS